MRNADLKKISEDMGLNSDAVRIVVFIESRGKGKHPITNDRFRTILHMAGPKKVSLALRLAESSGWIRRSKGGWGTPDFYEFVPTPRSTDPAEMEGTGDLFDPAKTEGTAGSLTLPGRKAQDTDPAKMEGTTRAREIRKRERVSDIDIKSRGGVGGNEIDPRVERRLKEGRWDGFRSSLLDYFSNRVTIDRQWGYLMTVQTWFDGGLAAPKGFGSLSVKDQRLLVASSVNELLAETPTQEKLNYKSSRGMEGSTNTLRTKLEFHIRRHRDEAIRKAQHKAKMSKGISPTTIGSNQPAFFPDEEES